METFWNLEIKYIKKKGVLAYLFTTTSVKSRTLILLYVVTKDGPAQIYKNLFYFLLPVQDLGMANVFKKSGRRV